MSDPARNEGRSRSRGPLSRLAGTVTGRVVESIDPDLIIDHVDVDHLLERVDVNGLLDRVDPNPILDRVDVNALLDRVDVDRLLDRVDPDRIVDRVDVDRLLDRVDPDRILDRVDVDRLLDRVDLEAAVRRAGIPEVVAESTGRMAGSVLDLARRQLVGLDVVVDRLIIGLLRRDPSRQPVGPPGLVHGDGADTPAQPGLTGHYAGPMSRAVAAMLDMGIAVGLFILGIAGFDLLARVLLGISPTADRWSPAWSISLAIWSFLYVFGSLAIAGRTPGKGIVGLRVVDAHGSTLLVRGALWRALAFPLSAALLGLGFVGIAVHREHRALHDLIAGTAVVYDWGGRTAELPGPLSAFLTRRAGSAYSATGGEEPIRR